MIEENLGICFIQIYHSQHQECKKNRIVMLKPQYLNNCSNCQQILNKLERERGLEEAQKQLLHVKVLFDEKKKCKWM